MVNHRDTAGNLKDVEEDSRLKNGLLPIHTFRTSSLERVLTGIYDFDRDNGRKPVDGPMITEINVFRACYFLL